MFVNSRFVVVDDKAEHLTGIKHVLDQLRYDCHTKLYEEENVADWSLLPGIRILFIDKNLRNGVTMGGGQASAFAAIAEVIEKIISPDSGPYGLILWAEEPDLEAFKTFLFERVDPKLLPVFCEQLRKGDYIDTGTGNVRDPAALERDILARLASSPQMKALFSWEADVIVAMDAVLKSLIELVPNDKKASNDFGSELGKVLYRISQAGAGIKQARTNPRESINRVLVPILADRILEHDPSGLATPDWGSALVDPTRVETIPLKVQASVNSAIHLSSIRDLPDGRKSISASDLGAVIEIPFALDDNTFSGKLGVTVKQLRGELFKATATEWQDCKLRLIQIGAPCDQAQPKLGPLLYLLGIEWAFANEDGSADPAKPSLCLGVENEGRKEPNRLSEWHSPVLKFPNITNPGKLSVYKNISISIPRPQITGMIPLYRLREELVGELTQEYARYISRPGVVTLPT